MADLSVNIGKLQLKNPVMTASGTFGYGLEFADFVNLEDIGGIIVKGTTLKPREGNPYPRMAETPQGMLNCVGLQNKGVDYFCGHIYPQIKDIRTSGEFCAETTWFGNCYSCSNAFVFNDYSDSLAADDDNGKNGCLIRLSGAAGMVCC